MARNSAIAWTNHTWNPWRGCHKISPGCAQCYMFREQRRWGHKPDEVMRAKDTTFRSPLNWPGPAYVFTCSWSDFFIEEADEWRGEAWDIIRATPLIYQILTKRVENVAERLPTDWGDGWNNVWLMASAENQEWLERRINGLLSIPAVLHGLSLEPLLGPVDLSKYLLCQQYPGPMIEPRKGTIGGKAMPAARFHPPLSWVIVGGESDRKAPRPMELDWARSIIEQCRAAGVACFVKQLGSAWAGEAGAKDWKGADPSEWPADLQVRQFPDKKREETNEV